MIASHDSFLPHVILFSSFLQCFTPKDLHDFEGSPPSKALNSTEFIETSPVIVFCLLPALEKNSGRTMCDLYPKNHSELFNVFARNFSDGNRSITHEALDRILEEINKTIGDFLTKTKVGELIACFLWVLVIDTSTVFDRHLGCGADTAKFILNVWDFGRL